MTVMVGTVTGLLFSALFADGLIGVMFRSFGIGEFRVRFSILGTFLPFIIVPLLFFLFAWAFSARLKQVSIAALIAENDD